MAKDKIRVAVIGNGIIGESHIQNYRGIPEAELTRSDVDLDAWLEGFHDTERSVRSTVEAVVNHPLMPSDVTVRGFIIDSATERPNPSKFVGARNTSYRGMMPASSL